VSLAKAPSLIHHLCEIWSESKCIGWVIASRGTWWLCFTTGFSCYSWWLPPPRWLGAARIIERRKVLVSGSNRVDCEGFLTFPQWRAKRYSSGLLMTCVVLILCWLCGTRLRVWRVMPISAWISKWVYRHNRTSLPVSKWTSVKNHCVILSRGFLGSHCDWWIDYLLIRQYNPRTTLVHLLFLV
jgi:hypothetical protein